MTAAPVAKVTVRTACSAVSGILLLIGTGADTTSLPSAVVKRLAVQLDSDLQFELTGFDDSRSTVAVDLDLIFINKLFRGRCLPNDNERGILERDVLAKFVLLFNGPDQEWSRVAVH